jgi:hypothetical protein
MKTEKGLSNFLIERVRVEGTVLVFRRNLALEDAIEFHAFAPVEARPCVWPMATLSGVRSSYRFTL